MYRRKMVQTLVLLLVLVLLVACGGELGIGSKPTTVVTEVVRVEVIPTEEVSLSTPTLEPTATFTETPAPTNTPEPTSTPEPTDTPSPTDTPVPTATLEPTVEVTILAPEMGFGQVGAPEAIIAQVEEIEARGLDITEIFQRYQQNPLMFAINPEGFRAREIGKVSDELETITLILPRELFTSTVNFGPDDIIKSPAQSVELNPVGNGQFEIVSYVVTRTVNVVSEPNRYRLSPPTEEGDDEIVFVIRDWFGECPIAAYGVWNTEENRLEEQGVIRFVRPLEPVPWDEGICVPEEDLDLVVGQGVIEFTQQHMADGRNSTIIYVNPEYSPYHGFFANGSDADDQAQMWSHIEDDSCYDCDLNVEVGEIAESRIEVTHPIKIGIGGAIGFEIPDFPYLYQPNYGLFPMYNAAPGVGVDIDTYERMRWCQETHHTAPGQICVLAGEEWPVETLVTPGDLGEKYSDYEWEDYLTGQRCGIASWYNISIVAPFDPTPEQLADFREGAEVCLSEWSVSYLYGRLQPRSMRILLLTKGRSTSGA